jgi:two-component sensor histidine kinase
MAGIFLGFPNVSFVNALVNRGFFSLVIVILAYFIGNYRNSVVALRESREELSRNGEILRKNEAELRASLQEKEVLLSEIHHRVRNNLTAFISLMSLEGEAERSAEERAFRLDLRNRAWSMALVHETLCLTKDYSQVDMDLYLSTLADQIAATFPPGKTVIMTVTAEGITMDAARATPCGLIVNELMTNALRHAFPESAACGGPGQEPCTVGIGLARNNGFYELTVSDNGIGLPASIDIRTAQSLGLKLVNFLARHELHASVDVDVSAGTRFTIRFGE